MSSDYEAACEVRDAVLRLVDEVEQLRQVLDRAELGRLVIAADLQADRLGEVVEALVALGVTLEGRS